MVGHPLTLPADDGTFFSLSRSHDSEFFLGLRYNYSELFDMKNMPRVRARREKVAGSSACANNHGKYRVFGHSQ